MRTRHFDLNPLTGDPENGVLARVPGEFIARGIKALPDPETATSEIVEVIVGGVPDLGVVLLTARRMKSGRPKQRRHFWTVFHAEVEPTPAAQIETIERVFPDLVRKP